MSRRDVSNLLGLYSGKAKRIGLQTGGQIQLQNWVLKQVFLRARKFFLFPKLLTFVPGFPDMWQTEEKPDKLWVNYGMIIKETFKEQETKFLDENFGKETFERTPEATRDRRDWFLKNLLKNWKLLKGTLMELKKVSIDNFNHPFSSFFILAVFFHESFQNSYQFVPDFISIRSKFSLDKLGKLKKKENLKTAYL